MIRNCSKQIRDFYWNVIKLIQVEILQVFIVAFYHDTAYTQNHIACFAMLKDYTDVWTSPVLSCALLFQRTRVRHFSNSVPEISTTQRDTNYGYKPVPFCVHHCQCQYKLLSLSFMSPPCQFYNNGFLHINLF